MTAALLGLLVATCVALAVEGYILIGRQQLQRNHLDQLLRAAGQLLALVPGKSAPRTDGAEDKPRRWWQKLAVAVDPAPELAPDETEPIRGLDLAGGARRRPAVADAPPPTARQLDAADEALVRFGLRPAAGQDGDR